jgi:hypothetical protein
MVEAKFHTHKTTGKIIVLYILIVMVLDSRWEDKSSELNGSKHYPDLICSDFYLKSNFGLLLSFRNIWTVSHFKRIQ